jgi:hypothetical protein
MCYCLRIHKKISGFDCKPIAINYITGATIESCKEQLAAIIAKNSNHYVTQPKIIFTQQGKGETQKQNVPNQTTNAKSEEKGVTEKQTITEDFGGVDGKFYLAEKPNGGSFVVTQLSNKTTDKLAKVLLKHEDGKIETEYLNPGAVFTKKYNTQKLEIQVIYLDSKNPGPDLDIIEFVKDQVRNQITNENGRLKSFKMIAIGVRG